MFYKIMDLLTGLVIATCCSPLEVLDVWAAKCSRNFGTLDWDQLNVTGLETIRKDAWKYCPSSIDPSFWIRRYTEVLKLKQFQVVCGDQSVDIRLWDRAIQQFETLRFRVPLREYWEARTLRPWFSLLEESVKTGKKKAMRRDKEPAMYRQNRMFAAAPMGENMPHLKHPNRGAKRVARSSIWQGSFARPSRAWKDQSRSCCQWGKHKRVRKQSMQEKEAICDVIREREKEHLQLKAS